MTVLPAFSSTYTVAIVGGGFSGAMVAVNLLQQSGRSLSIKLIESRRELGRGIAYSTPIPGHLLNVPAAKMSAFPDAPDHFLAWLQHQPRRHLSPNEVDAATFVPRQVYGDYIQDCLREAIAQASPQVQFEHLAAEAVALKPAGPGALIQLDTGEAIYADHVVLATGNFPAPFPQPFRTLSKDSAALKEAWAWTATAHLHPEDSVLLVGTGLTMVDMVIALHQQGHRGKTYALSRHGLLPQRHQTVAPYPTFIDLENVPRTIRALLRRVRYEVKTAAAQGQDWRAVLDALRPVTQLLWQQLPGAEQRRFLRHVKAYWEVYRHRIASEIAEVLDALFQSGQLVQYGGRLQSCTADDTEVEVCFQQRGTGVNVTLNVTHVINCTGAHGDYCRIQHPLLECLRQQRLIRAGTLGIGIETTPTGMVLSEDNQAVPWLYTLGAARRGSLWESVAVPELRIQAQDVAQEIWRAAPIPIGVPAALSTHATAPVPLIFRQLFDKESSTYTYLIADPNQRVAALVDPVFTQVERDLQVLRELDCQLLYTLETHVHADHITGADRLRRATQCQIVIPQDVTVQGADRALQDGEVLWVGAIGLRAIATPGHTASHLAYLVNQTHLLTGDALFIRGCGRTDFQGGDAGILYDVVTRKLFTLPDETLVYPSHDYQGRTASTIGEEKRWNPRFANRDRQQFIDLMGKLNLPYPQKMNQAIPANQRCGAVLEPHPELKTFDIYVNSSIDLPTYYAMYI